MTVQSSYCLPCPANSTATLDKSRCLSCPQGIDEKTGECACPKGNALIEKNIYGQYLIVKECIACPEGSYPGPNAPVYACKPCPINKSYDTNRNPWVCTCNMTDFITAGDSCVPISDSQYLTSNYPINLAKSLTFTFQETIDINVDGTLTIASSDTFDYLYLKSAYSCIKGADPENYKSCQVLANLCVLQMYDFNSPVCKLYTYISNMKPAIASTEYFIFKFLV
jgi:meckelin